jgi:hypothetical protein
MAVGDRPKFGDQRLTDWTRSRLYDYWAAGDWPHDAYLDKIMDERFQESLDSIRRWTDVDAAIRSADADRDLGPLRGLFPDIARFINPPKLRRGQHRTKPERRWPFPPRKDRVEDRAKLAAAEATLIRAIWKYHYKRTRVGETPEKIAAEDWDVTVDAIKRWQKHRPSPSRP